MPNERELVDVLRAAVETAGGEITIPRATLDRYRAGEDRRVVSVDEGEISVVLRLEDEDAARRRVDAALQRRARGAVEEGPNG